MNKPLDPEPYRHILGGRSPMRDGWDRYWVFSPRPGYAQLIEDYS